MSEDIDIIDSKSLGMTTQTVDDDSLNFASKSLGSCTQTFFDKSSRFGISVNRPVRYVNSIGALDPFLPSSQRSESITVNDGFAIDPYAFRIRSRGPADYNDVGVVDEVDEDEPPERDYSGVIERLGNDARSKEFLDMLYNNRDNPNAFDLVARQMERSAHATNQQLEAMEQNNTAPFHPSISGVIDNQNVYTRPLTMTNLPNRTDLPVFMDADSLYWISTNPKELLSKLLVLGESVFNFQSLTSRLDANKSSRFSVTGSEKAILQRVRGKMPPKINLEKYPNVRLATVDSGKPGVSSYINMYFLGLDYIPKEPYFTNVQLGLVNVALNIARKAIPTGRGHETYSVFNSNFSHRDMDRGARKRAILSYTSRLEKLPIFESPMKEGHGNDKMKRVNRNTAFKGLNGRVFLQVFFS